VHHETSKGLLPAEALRFPFLDAATGVLLALLRYELDVPSLEFANRLSEEHGVMLAPGSAFGFKHHLRIGIGQDPPVFAEGLRRAGAFFAELRGS